MAGADVAAIEAARRKRLREANRAIGETASHINAAMARMLTHLGAFLDDDGWFEDGAKTPEEWVGWRLGVSPGDARHHVRIARKLRELPLVSGAFSRGELSYWQVRAIVPIATEAIEEELLNIARYATAGQLQRIAKAYKGCLDRAELEAANEAHRQRSLDYYFDSDGFLNLRGRLTADEGAVLVAALEAAEQGLRDELPEDGRDGPNAEQIRADALGEVARAALASSGATGPVRPSVAIHVDVPSLIDGVGERCEISDGPSLASETARRLTCDCSYLPYFEGDDELKDLGRRRRTVSPRMRKLLEERDGTCVFPGCDRKRFLDAHHIVHWSRGGETKSVNLALLCPHHHRLVHEGGYSMQLGDDTTFTFLRPDGSIVAARPELGDGDPARLFEASRKEQLRIDADTCTTLWDGKAVNYDYCVLALLGAGGKLEVPRRGPPE